MADLMDIRAALAALRTEPTVPPLEGEQLTDERPAEVELLSAGAIEPQPVRWLWPGWLARGKLHLLAGRPGQGKTQIALALAAIITRAGRWPDGSRCETAGSAVIWSGEDDPRDTLVPRLMAAGADLDRVLLVGPVTDDAGRRPFDPATDLPLLAAKLRLLKPSLLIVDPVVATMGAGADSHKNAEVRRALQPLVDLAAELDAALLGVTHLAKATAGRDPTERVTGSIAFAALARVVLMAAKREDPPPGEPARLLLRPKSNIGSDAGGVGYDIERIEVTSGIWTSRVRWGGVVEGSARELLAQAEAAPDDETGALADAASFLRSLLADGPMPQRQVMVEASGAGYSEATIRRAKRMLGVEAARSGFGRSGTWVWALPAAIDDRESPKMLKPKSLSTYGAADHLCAAPAAEAPQPPAAVAQVRDGAVNVIGDPPSPPVANHAPLVGGDLEVF
ncbi:AAA domain protein [Tepidimonas sediminis]|uniref:AAA domain protein n=1 Tax=Tepidimonas sediminis TaxID=2588941 RepID=A0A554WTI6_9BURK|nr:AAA family ATPase [Tepidimonas sediminis]TSE26908.1 AAA domain protein [Tepidimonas sediminis]